MCLQYREGDFSWKPCDSTLNTSNSSNCPLACYACEAEFEHYCPIVSSEKQIFTIDDDGRYIWLCCFFHFLSENEISHISVILCKNKNSYDDFWVIQLETPLTVAAVLLLAMPVRLSLSITVPLCPWKNRYLLLMMTVDTFDYTVFSFPLGKRDLTYLSHYLQK